MQEKEKTQGRYVRGVLEETRQYVRKLLDENEALRTLADSLAVQREELTLRLQELSVATESQLRKQEELHQNLLDMNSEREQFTEQYLSVQQRNANLANLYDASYRLHSTLDRKEVFAAIREIVSDLIGSEELAVFEANAEGTELSLVFSEGVEAGGYERIPFGSGLIGGAAATGELYVADEHDRPAGSDGDSPSACIPLVLDERVTGVIAIFRLLEQKSGFEDVDHELFELLATHAATALYCTSIHAKTTLDVSRV
ncbi:MAG: GAF domain-containing protein [Planctomycetota bacterium]|nr:GAF domain-containing protein [Planctomycetota bacterium]